MGAAAMVVGGAANAASSVMAGREEAKSTEFQQQQTGLQGRQFARRARLEQRQFEESTRFDLQQFELSEAERQRTLKLQGQDLRIAQAQAETERREALTSNLETIMALRAGRGVGEGPTSRAAYGKLISDSLADIRSERLSYSTAIDQARRESELSKGQVKLARKTTKKQIQLSRTLTASELRTVRKQVNISRAQSRRKAKASILAGYVGAVSAAAGTAYGLSERKAS